MVEISITDQFTPLLNEMALSGEDLSPVLGQIGELMVDSVHENFDWQGRPELWEPRQDDNYWPILMHTGNLLHSIHYEVEGGFSVSVGSDVPYAGFHQQGTSKMPARPFLLIQDQDTNEIENLLVQHFHLEGF